MPMDDAPRKPPRDDLSQQTLDTRTPSVTPNISYLDPGQPRTSEKISAFSPGHLIAKRFRIERFIAHGGMGEVYEALDIELKQKVALKTVRSVLLADVQSLERFRQEIVVAKRVTHPNVCRTFDLFRHESDKPGESDILVVSMELLSGHTLDQFLKQKGKLSTIESLPLLKQMVAGLSAAHQAGVVHRDFKSNNVLLVPPASGSGSVRVVITDFGLAHSLDPAEFALTRTGEMLGTPAFMAPEQVAGKAITPATDIYALGVVLFEILTGRLPFSGANWRELAFNRLEAPAPSPKSILPELDDRWSRAILKCLEREPSDRFQNVEDVERAIAGEDETLLRSEITLRQRRNRILFASLALLAVAVIGVVIGVAFPNLLPRRQTPSVAVLGFKNLSGDPNLDRWGNELRTNLGGTLDVAQIRYMSPQATEPVWKYQSPHEMPEEPSSETLARLYKIGCHYVVFGTYTVEGVPPHRRILWSIRLVNTRTGESLGGIPKSITEDQLVDVIPTAGAEVRRKLGVSLSPAETRGADRAIPINDEASKAFAEGQVYLQRFQYAQAKDAFLAASEADPTNAAIRSALAESFWQLGYETRARDEAKRAADLADSLSGDKNSLIRARYLAYSGKWDDAADFYASLWKINPDKYSYALLLAQSQIAGKHYPEALATLRKLDHSRLPEPILAAEVKLALAEVQARLGNNTERLQDATSAAELAKSLGAGLLQARAEIAQCQALLDLGKTAEASTVCANAVALNQQQGDDLGSARAQNSVANNYFNHGDYDKAEPLYQQALAIATRIGDMRDQAGALFNLGNIQRSKGNFPEAKKFFERSIQVSQERSGINNDLLLAKLGLADVSGSTGDTSSEIRILHEVIDEARPFGDRENLSMALLNLCGAQLQTGAVSQAPANCQEALQLMVNLGDQQGQARAQQTLGDVLLASDQLPDAESHYQLALKLQQALDAKDDVAYTQLSLADLSVNTRDFPAAEKFAQSALQYFLAKSDPAGEVAARCALSQVYLGLNRHADAEQQLVKAKDHLRDLQDPATRAAFLIQQAAVQNSPKPSQALLSDLKKLELESRKAGMLQLALEARLAQAESLTGPARKSALNSLAKEATQHGYRLLARKAAAT